MEDERPPEVRRDHRRHGGRLGALLGVVIGFGLAAAIGWAVVERGGGEGNTAAADPSTAATKTAPPDPILRIIFPEGFTRGQMAQRITAVNEIAAEERDITTSLDPRAYLRSTARVQKRFLPEGFRRADAPNLEGFLFPATYEFVEDTIARELVELQLLAFDDAWVRVDMTYARRRKLTPYDVLIIASMIEKEVVVPRERALVAAVIYNRLKRGMPLGIDATIRYGLDIPPTEAITQQQLDSDNPYNTRRFPGLPPTPIANPGLAAIQAAAHPADVNYLYFVRKADCRSHFFTRSEREFHAYPREGLQC